MLDRGSSEFDVCDAQYITPQAISSSLICRLQATPLYRRDPHPPQSLHTHPQISSVSSAKMGFELRQLWSAPEINPYNKKAKSIPVFNPFDKYGRVFFFSYLGFFIAFWSW